MCCTRKSLSFFLLLFILIELSLIYYSDNFAPIGFLGWEEISNPSEYYLPNSPDPPYKLDKNSRDLIAQKVAEAHVLSGVDSDFDRIASLRNWTRNVCPKLHPDINSNSPSDILKGFDEGKGVLCGGLASLYCAALLTHGYRARIVQLIRDETNIARWTHGPPDTHVTVEVFSPQHSKWIVMDPTFNCWFHLPDDTTPLSARELQILACSPPADFSQTGWISLAEAGTLVPEYDRSQTSPKVETYYIDPCLLYKNVFLLYYNVWQPPVTKWQQKLSRIILARLMGKEKIVRLLAPGQKRSIFASIYLATNWLPLGILIITILIITPFPPPPTEEIEEEEEKQNEEEEELDQP